MTVSTMNCYYYYSRRAVVLVVVGRCFWLRVVKSVKPGTKVMGEKWRSAAIFGDLSNVLTRSLHRETKKSFVMLKSSQMVIQYVFDSVDLQNLKSR
jgi:hypothetical protein